MALIPEVLPRALICQPFSLIKKSLKGSDSRVQGSALVLEAVLISLFQAVSLRLKGAMLYGGICTKLSVLGMDMVKAFFLGLSKKTLTGLKDAIRSNQKID